MTATPPFTMSVVPRLRAAGVHLGLSIVVAALAAALVLGVWYPPPYRSISGGRELFALVVSVDAVLGPLITLAVFDRRKPRRELARDMLVVAALQLAALAYGLHTVWVARPVHLVFEVDRFRVVRAIDIETEQLKLAPDELRHLPMTGPTVIAAEAPSDPAERLEAIQLALAGADISLRPQYWRSYASMRDQVLRSASPLAELRRRHPERRADIDLAVDAGRTSIDGLRYLPIIAREKGWVALLDARTADVVGALPFGGY